MGKIVLKCHFKGKTCRKLANELNLYDLKKTLTPGVILTLPWGYIHIVILVKQVYWYLRSQVSVYRTVGPLVYKSCLELDVFYDRVSIGRHMHLNVGNC